MLPIVLPRLSMNEIENTKIHINELLAEKRAIKRACALRIVPGTRLPIFLSLFLDGYHVYLLLFPLPAELPEFIGKGFHVVCLACQSRKRMLETRLRVS